MYSVIASRNKENRTHKKKPSLDTQLSSRKKYLSLTTISNTHATRENHLTSNTTQIQAKVLENMTNRKKGGKGIQLRIRRVSQLTADSHKQTTNQRGVKDRMRQFKKRLTNLQDLLNEMDLTNIDRDKQNLIDNLDWLKDTPINKLLEDITFEETINQ